MTLPTTRTLFGFCLLAFYMFQHIQTTQGNTYFMIGSNNVTVENKLSPIPNAYNQCYVNIYVFNSSSLTYGLEDATVTILSNKKNDSLYEFYATEQTDSKGQACVLVKCQSECEIFVEKNDIRILAIDAESQKLRLPERFRVSVEKGNEIVNFHSFVWGTVNGRSGPVFNSDEKTMCTAGHSTDYHFTFSYISVPDQLVSTPTPIDSNGLDHDLAWFYDLFNVQACYLKIKIKTRSTEATFTATSRKESRTGSILGTYIAGPKYDMALSDITTKAVCLQFRCPVIDFMNGIPVKTFVSGNVSVPGRQAGCCVSEHTFLDVLAMPSDFSVTFSVDENYGPSQGVYKGTPASARSRCYTGHNFLGTDYAMNVDTNTAFEYDCTDTCVDPLDGPVVG